MKQRLFLYRLAIGACAIFLAFLFFNMNGSVSVASAAIGNPAPQFSGTTSQGKTVNLSDFKGKYVILEWSNHECPFVVKHYGSGNMQKLQKTYTDKGAAWLTVLSSAAGQQGHVDAAGANKIAADKGSAASHIILDEKGVIGKAYDAKTTPHMFIVDPQGILIYEGAIDSNSSADPADIAGSQNFVVSAMDEVLAGKPVTVSATRPYGCSVKY